MADDSGIWASINDKCWGIVEAVRLDGVFTNYGLPPVLLPLAVVLLILILFFALSGGGAPAAPTAKCGDGVCQAAETMSGCPGDCGPATPARTGKKITVQLDKTPTCQLTVKLYTNASSPLTQKATRTKFEFEDVDSDTAYAQLEGPTAKTQKTPTTDLKNEDTINVVLDATLCEAPLATTQVLWLTIKDSETQQTLDAVKVSIAEMNNGYAANYPVKDQVVNGAYDFRLTAGKTYAVLATREGYVSYDGTKEPITLSSAKGVPKTITMSPAVNTDPTGDVEVCVKKNGQALTSGLVVVEGTGDVRFLGDLSAVDPATEPSGAGCYVFKSVPAGTIATAVMSTPPEGCAPKVTLPITVEAAKRTLVDLVLECGSSGSGFVKVKVIGGTNLILTQNATVTVWTKDSRLVPGTGIAASLAEGSNGYTEEVAVPANSSFYVWARGVSGYDDRKSGMFSVAKGEHKAVELKLNSTDQSTVSVDFVFSGATAPKTLALNQTFRASVAQILYGETVLTGSTAALTASVGASSCTVSYDTVWKIDCVAPSVSGDYDLSLKAKYGKKSGTHTLPLQVRTYYQGLLTITPLFSTQGEPPVELFYDIRLNDTPVTALAGQNLTVTYLDSPGAYAGTVTGLEYLPDSGYWTLAADVPFRGSYAIDAYLEAYSAGAFYTGNYTLEFTSTSNSKDLKAELYLSDDMLAVGGSFDAEVILKFKDKVAYGLDILELYMNGVFYTLPWKAGQNIYALAMSAPSSEVCNLQLRLMIKDDEIAKPVMIHVIDIGGTKSGTCPLDRQDGCDSIEEVRKCLNSQEARSAFYTEEQMATCITSGCGLTQIPDCKMDNKGDLVPDCQLTEDDAQMASEYLTVIASQADRNKLAPCLDMDNDGDVDDEDVGCLSSMVATKWFGDVDGGEMGGGTCKKQLKGGFCFDMDIDSPLPGDMYYDGQLGSEDDDIMLKIIEATGHGVTPSKEMLKVADFNQDGNIDSVDEACLKRLYTVDFDTAEILPSSQPLSSDCLKIFGMACDGEPADLNADGDIEIIDLIIEKLMIDEGMVLSGNLSAQMFPCADVDDSGFLDGNDILCISYYLAGDEERWMACLGCAENLPAEAVRDYEICADGFDNNCDGITDDEDPNCQCNENTDCNVVVDGDDGTSIGIADGNYKVCAKMETTGGYAWTSAETVNGECDEEKDWKSTYMCGSQIMTCVFDYPIGFRMSDDYTTGDDSDDSSGSTDWVKFKWLAGEGNQGPLGYVERCGNAKCSWYDGWDIVDSHHGGTCDKGWGDNRKRWAQSCRWKYDMCETEKCEEIDGGVEKIGQYTCTEETACTPVYCAADDEGTCVEGGEPAT